MKNRLLKSMICNNQQEIERKSKNIMLLQRLRWLLPLALIAYWMNLQLGAALPAHNEHSHVSAYTFGPSATTSTMIRQDYNKRVHPPVGKNNTQSSHKLVASPAGLLRPDKFQFYTYNDKGDMITRQMTAQEIQGLIAAGGTDHVAMDRQEPQKADDVLTGGKKVMDVVQKVQNVLKSALDKPPTLTGSVPKIPEHANVEWSNILPSILSGETDAISLSGESNQSSHKLTTEKIEVGSAVSLAESANIGTSMTSKYPTKKPVTSDVQTNAYAGFTNNIQHSEKPQHSHHSQQTSTSDTISEKPMIPVPVITLTEQKLSTLQSTVTESPVFQMLSVIPVESVHKEDQIDSSTTDIGTASFDAVQSSTQTEEFSQTEQFVELNLSEVPEDTTFSLLTSPDMYPINITKQNLDNKTGQGMGVSSIYYSITTPGTSTDSFIVDTKQTVMQNESNEATNITDKISFSNASYILIHDTNNTKTSEDSLFVPGVTKESQVNGTHNDDKIIPQINTATLGLLSHTSVPLKSDEVSNETALHSSSTFASVSRIETSTVSTLPHTDRLGEDSPIVTKESLSSITPTYMEDHLNPQPVEIQSLAPIAPLPTQLIDSFSSVMHQVSEVKPPVLSLSSVSDDAEISIVKINYDQGSESDKTTITSVDTQYDMATSHDTNEENAERIVSAQTYATVTTQVSSQDRTTTRLVDYSITQRPVNAIVTDRESITIDNVPASSRITMMASTAPTRIEATTNNLAITPAGLNAESVDTIISESTTSSPVRIQLEKIHNASLGDQIKIPATLEITTATNIVLEKHATDKITSSEKILPITSITPNVIKIQSTTASIDTNKSSNKPTPIYEYLDNALANLNLSNPVSAIDQVLNIAPLPSSVPAIEPIGLPNDTTNLAASGLASGLIAGFASTSEISPIKKTSENQMLKVTSNGHTVRPTVSSNITKLAESIENITEMYKEITKLNVNSYQKEKNTTYTQAPIQQTLKDPIGNGTLIMQTKETSNDTSEITKLSNSDEKIDNPTKVSLSSSSNKFANVNDKSNDSTGQSTIIEEIVITNPKQSLTIDVDIQSSNINKTLTDTNDNKKKTENGEKVKITEVSNVKTEMRPELSQVPVKIALIDSANDTRNSVNLSGHAESSQKIETLDRKNGSFVNTSSATKEAAAVHSLNDSNSTLHTSHEYISNVTSNAAVPNVTFNAAVVSTGNFIDSAFLQNSSRINNTIYYKNKYNTNTVQNNKDSYNNYSSFLSIQEHISTDNPIVKITQELSDDTIENKEEFSQPSLVNGTNNLNSDNNTSNQNNKNMTQMIIHNADIASMKNVSTDSDNTDSKPASLKHSENFPKPEVIRLQLSTPLPNIPVRQTPKPAAIGHRPSEKSDVLKTDTDVNVEDKWTLISQQTQPAATKFPKPPKPLKKPVINHAQTSSSNSDENINVRSPEAESAHQQDQQEFSAQTVLPLDASQSASGLDVTIRHTSADIVNFAKLCNELAFNFWVATNKGLSTARSLALSPFGMTSLLAMIFLGARGPTSDQMNEVLGLDDVATFNPHLVFQNITDAVSLARSQGIANAAFVRELFADKMKVRKLMPFYKEQAQQFYEGLVAEVNFATISDLVRRRTNLLIRKQTGGRIKDFVKTNTVPLRSPLAALSANVFQTDCNSTLTNSVGRDGELYFAVSPAVRQRKLVPVPATTWRSSVLAGYEPSIDATAVALGASDRLVSTIFVLPGQQGHTAPGDTLDRLEQRLIRSAFRDGAWNKLLKVLIPRSGLELQVPKFSHRSVVNATAALKRMGLDELFSGNADFKGINGIGHRLYLADVLQMNLFSTCGDENILGGRHHVETYPASPLRRNIKRQMEDTDNFGNTPDEDAMRRSDVSSQEDHVDSFYMDRSNTDQFYRKKRQLSGSSERPRLKLDRPFLYFVRHNPSGIILHMGRFNPRLLP